MPYKDPRYKIYEKDFKIIFKKCLKFAIIFMIFIFAYPIVVIYNLIMTLNLKCLFKFCYNISNLLYDFNSISAVLDNLSNKNMNT